MIFSPGWWPRDRPLIGDEPELKITPIETKDHIAFNRLFFLVLIETRTIIVFGRPSKDQFYSSVQLVRM